MRGLNRLFLIGRLGQDPELRRSPGGTPWCALSVATSRGRVKDGAWVEETDWHDVRVFGDDAVRCEQRLRKGSAVAVEGALIYDSWTDDAGQRRRKARVVCNRVQFLAGLREAGAPSTGGEATDPVDDALQPQSIGEPDALSLV